MDLRKFVRWALPLAIVVVAACSDPVGTPPSPEEEGKSPPTDDTEAVVDADSLVVID